jgi:hypothetical protein
MRAAFLPARLWRRALLSGVVVVLLAISAAAQTQYAEQVLWSFGGYLADGWNPAYGAARDASGNLYGTTYDGGTVGSGSVWKLTPPASGGDWAETIIHEFCATGGPDYCPDGAGPASNLVFDSKGNLYGTTNAGGTTQSGTVFELSPPTSPGGDWTETVLYSFCPLPGPCLTGADPFGNLTLDSKGNIYGTTSELAWELSPPAVGGTEWTYTVLFDFCNPSTGVCPYPYGPASGGALSLDASGNLYGTTMYGGVNSACNSDDGGCGSVFELSPPTGGGSSWTATVLYSFCSLANCADGEYPYAGVVPDSQGNFYGTTANGGANPGCWNGFGCGVVFELSPPTGGGTAWTETVLYSFCPKPGCTDGGSPTAGLVFDSHGSLYGTTAFGGATQNPTCLNGCGTAFELSPPAATGGAWTERALHSFCSQPGCADGEVPEGGLILDSVGDMYGVTGAGGAFLSCIFPVDNTYLGCGTVFELSPVAGGTTTSLAVSPSTVTAGSTGPVAMTATVTPVGGSGTPAGTVSFFNGAAPVGSGTLSGGVAEYDYDPAALAVGTYSMTAVYAGDGEFGGSTSPPELLAVLAPGSGTETTLASGVNPSVSGESVRFTATVTPYPGPTGAVTFSADGAALSCGAVALSGGSAQCTTSALAVGSHAMVAAYSGDSQYGGSSGALTQVVMVPAAAGNFQVTASPGNQTARGGGQALFTVTVASQDGFAGAIALSCAVAPPGGACTLGQSTLNLAANGTATTMMAVSTTAQDAGLLRGFSLSWGVLALGLPIVRGASRRRRRPRALVLLALLGAAAAALSCGCPTGHVRVYTVAVTGTSNLTTPAATSSTTVTLAVE